MRSFSEGIMKQAKLLIGLILVLPSIVFAGDNNWLFRIQSVSEINPNRLILVLSPVESGKTFPLNCKPLIIHSQYDFHWWQLSRSKDITKAKHDKAISLIKKAYREQKSIKIGSMGEGFGFVNDQTSCEVRSRAFSIIENKGTQEIYSFFK